MKRSIKNVMVGKFFHSIGSDGKIEWQGKILDMPKDGLYLIQLCDWMMGEPSDQMLKTIDDMKGWLFYDRNEDMVFAYEYGAARSLRHNPENNLK